MHYTDEDYDRLYNEWREPRLVTNEGAAIAALFVIILLVTLL